MGREGTVRRCAPTLGGSGAGLDRTVVRTSFYPKPSKKKKLFWAILYSTQVKTNV